MSSDEAFIVEVFAALKRAKLEAVMVGASAAILQGAPLMTRDVDLLIRDTPRNRQKLKDFCNLMAITGVVRPSETVKVLTLLGRPVGIDVIFDHISGDLRFESLKSRAVLIKLGEQEGLVAELRDVIKSKEAANRPKDLVHLITLRDTLRVRELMKKSEPE